MHIEVQAHLPVVLKTLCTKLENAFEEDKKSVADGKSEKVPPTKVYTANNIKNYDNVSAQPNNDLYCQ